MLIQNEQQQQQPQAKKPKQQQQQQQQKLTAIDAGCSSSRSRQRESRRRIMSISFYAVRQCPNYLPPSLSPAHSHALPFAATAAKAKKKTFVRTDTQVLPGSFTLPLRACALRCTANGCSSLRCSKLRSAPLILRCSSLRSASRLPLLLCPLCTLCCCWHPAHTSFVRLQL